MKSNKVLPIIYALTFFFVCAGTTFAYFSRDAKSGEGALKSTSAIVGIDLGLSPLYGTKSLIPMNDVDVMTAYENECIDIKGFGACKAYTITVTNIGEALEYEGIIKFTLTEITNLNYLVLDEDDNEYVPITNIVTDTDQTLGASFNLGVDETKIFKLIIWVPNFDYYQDEYDGGGSFNALVTYRSADNHHIAGSITGN